MQTILILPLEEGSRSFNDKDIPFSHEKLNDCCDICTSYEEHKFKAVQSRLAYKEDAIKVNSLYQSYFSVELQKFTMLPRLPGVKTVAFTRRIIAFKETFAPLGNKNLVKDKSAKPITITWHHAGGRCAQEVCSSYHRFINDISNRDVANFIF